MLQNKKKQTEIDSFFKKASKEKLQKGTKRKGEEEREQDKVDEGMQERSSKRRRPKRKLVKKSKIISEEAFIDILKKPEMHVFSVFPTLEEFKKYDPQGRRFIKFLRNACEPSHYDENFCESIAERLVEFAKVSDIQINALNKKGRALIHSLILQRRKNIIKIISNTPYLDKNARDSEGENSLFYAITKNDRELVSTLLELEDDIYRIGQAFCNACERGHMDMVNDIFEKKQKELLEEKEGINEAWLMAARSDHHELIELLQPHVDMRVADEDGNTALHMACESHYIDLIDYLCQFDSAGLTNQNEEGYRAFELALISEEYDPDSFYEIVRFFMEHDLEPNIQFTLRIFYLTVDDEEEELKSIYMKNATLLHVFAFRNDYKSLKELLRHPDIDINTRDSDGRTPLFYATYYGHEEIVARLLIAKEITVNSRYLDLANKKGHADTALLIATEIEKREKANYFFNTMYGKFFVKNLALTYGGKLNTEKDVRIGTNLRHENMRLRGLLSQKAGDEQGNYLTASLSFVVSDRHSEHPKFLGGKRYTVSLDLLPKKTLLHITDMLGKNSKKFLENVIYRLRSAPEEFRRTATDYISDDKPITGKTIQSIHGTSDFYKLFHHSEQALFEYLENSNNVKALVEKLKEEGNLSEGTKVYFAVLDIYSTNGMCPNCLVSTLGEQNPEHSKFLRYLEKHLDDAGFSLPAYRKLKFITRVNADNLKITPDMRPRELESIPLDLRSFDGKCIIEHNALGDQTDFSAFVSRKPHLRP